MSIDPTHITDEQLRNYVQGVERDPLASALPSCAMCAEANRRGITAVSDPEFHPGIQEKGGYLAHGQSMFERLASTWPPSFTCPPPDRALRVVLDLSADDVDELGAALDRIRRDLTRGPTTNGGTSGSYGHGYHVEVRRRDVTHEEFVADLEAWRASR
jgi:hypothetical protein